MKSSSCFYKLNLETDRRFTSTHKLPLNFPSTALMLSFHRGEASTQNDCTSAQFQPTESDCNSSVTFSPHLLQNHDSPKDSSSAVSPRLSQLPQVSHKKANKPNKLLTDSMCPLLEKREEKEGGKARHMEGEGRHRGMVLWNLEQHGPWESWEAAGKLSRPQPSAPGDGEGPRGQTTLLTGGRQLPLLYPTWSSTDNVSVQRAFHGQLPSAFHGWWREKKGRGKQEQGGRTERKRRRGTKRRRRRRKKYFSLLLS